jgi:hypothetical protein
MSAIPSIPTGTERWNRSVARERIIYEMRALIQEATSEPAVNFPEFYDWARDLRRGRTNIAGGFFRLVDGIKRRGMGLRGRQLALGVLALERDYVDLMLPEGPAPTPTAERIPLRFVRPIRPTPMPVRMPKVA